MLIFERVSKTYPNGVQALEEVSLQVAAGELLVVIGSSGCGKSTLLRAASGLDTPTRGRVLLDGMTVAAPHERIGILFQEPRLLPWLRVRDNVGFGLRSCPKIERDKRVAIAIERMGLADKRGVWPRELSGGQAQRVAIARALVTRPSVLLLDEPFSALDAFTRTELQDQLLDLWEEARPILVLVTHDIEEALVLGSRIAVMRPQPGRIARILDVPLPRPRDRLSPAFEEQKRRVLKLLDSTLNRQARNAPLHDFQI